MRTIHRWATVGLALPLLACEAGPTAPAHARGPSTVTAHFNPQPEPPPAIFDFSMQGQLEDRWVGTFGVRGGTVMAENLMSEMQGETLHLAQEWTFVPPDPIFPPEPVVPPEPIVPPEPVRLMGIVNLATGALVLNGLTDEGVPVHVRGQITEVGGGIFSIGGEVMFNPQPEPPPGR